MYRRFVVNGRQNILFFLLSFSFSESRDAAVHPPALHVHRPNHGDLEKATPAVLQIPDRRAGERVRELHLHLQVAAVGAIPTDQPVGEADQDLVPKPPHQGQEAAEARGHGHGKLSRREQRFLLLWLRPCHAHPPPSWGSRGSSPQQRRSHGAWRDGWSFVGDAPASRSAPWPTRPSPSAGRHGILMPGWRPSSHDLVAAAAIVDIEGVRMLAEDIA